MKKFLLTMSLMAIGVVAADMAAAAAKKPKAGAGAGSGAGVGSGAAGGAGGGSTVLQWTGDAKAPGENRCGAGCGWTPRITDPFTYVSRHYPRPGEGSYPTDGSTPQPIETSWPVLTFIGASNDLHGRGYLQEGSYANMDVPHPHYYQAPYYTEATREEAHKNKARGLFGYVATMAEDSDTISYENFYSMTRMLHELAYAGPHALPMRYKSCKSAYKQLEVHLKFCQRTPLNSEDLARNRKKLVNRVNNFDGKCYPFIAGFKQNGPHGGQHHINGGYDARVHLDFDAHKRYIHFIQSVNGQVDMNNDAIFKKIRPLLGHFMATVKAKMKLNLSAKAVNDAASSILDE